MPLISRFTGICFKGELSVPLVILIVSKLVVDAHTLETDMSEIFVISDTHFDDNMLTFKGADGLLLRPFDTVKQMNEFMIERWNSVVVKTSSKVYHLGDVGNPTYLLRCNGHKRIVLGNHDKDVKKKYGAYFEEFYGSRLIDKLLFTHYPVHPFCLGKAIANVHGHIHKGLAAADLGPLYLNLSVEVVNYTPVAVDDIMKKLEAQKILLG